MLCDISMLTLTSLNLSYRVQASNYFEIPGTDPAMSVVADDEATNNFLDDGNALVLTMNLETRPDGDRRIHLNNLPSPGQPDDKVILFYKRKPDVITPDTMHKVSKTTVLALLEPYYAGAKGLCML